MKLSNSQLKYLKSLHLRKYRQKYHNFIVEGTKMAGEALRSRTFEVEGIFALPGWLDENAGLSEGLDDRVFPVSEVDLKKISLLSTPNQVLLVLREPALKFDAASITSGLSLYLEDIQDPGNFGTILRIADWFGIPWVFCSPGSVEVFNPKVVQASMGAFLRVKCLSLDFDFIKNELPGLPVYGTVLDGASVFSTLLQRPALIAIGNESRGLSGAVQQALTHRISIPRGVGGGAESLNAAVAAGIVCAVFRNFPG